MWVERPQKETAFADEVSGDETGGHRDGGRAERDHRRDGDPCHSGEGGKHTSAGTLAGNQRQRPRSDRYYADTNGTNDNVITIINIVPITS
jgi:hypothetical protein